MDKASIDRLRKIIEQAEGLEGKELAQFADSAVRANPELRVDIENLLVQDPDLLNGLKTGAMLNLDDSDPPADIGPYHILGKIGEGGFGVVYEAEQRKPVHRRVALKVLKAGMDTSAVLKRFRAEHQALALMEHPHIAHVYGAGKTDSGLPYFVMELVKGEPIDVYADSHELSIRERLELFVPVCQAVQHAHLKGVIHRDIKPSNILVTTADGLATPKVIDFGIAKATSLSLTQETIFTSSGMLLGTPEYMSPEQFDMSGLDVDMRTDVYSLGVVLYYLLTGLPPFDFAALRRGGLSEIQRHVVSEEPKPIATRIAQSENNDSIARMRKTQSASLIRSLRGELDWITRRAIEKDRTKRYQTANALALDVERHLRNEPVLARPQTALYSLRKLASRNRAALAVAGSIVFGLVVASVGLGLAFKKSNEQRKIAVDALAEAEAIASYFQSMLEAVNPFSNKGDVSMLEVIRQTSETLTDDFEHRPLIESRLRHTIGVAYRKLNDHDAALMNLERSYAQRLLALEESDPRLLATMNELGILYGERGELAKCESLLTKTLDLKRRYLPPHHPDLYSTTGKLANLYREQGRWALAEPLMLETLEQGGRARGARDPGTIKAIHNLAVVYHMQSKLDKAREHYYRALKLEEEVLGDDDYLWLSTSGALAGLDLREGRYEEAKERCVKVIEKANKNLGKEHATTVTFYGYLAGIEEGLGNIEAADSLYRANWITRIRISGENHSRTLSSQTNYAKFLIRKSRFAEAEPLIQGALEKTRIHNPNHVDNIAGLLRHYGIVLRETNRYPAAEQKFSEALALLQNPDENHANLISEVSADLANLQERAGNASPVPETAATAAK